MIKAEIMTNQTTYTLDLPSAANPAEGLDLVRHRIDSELPFSLEGGGLFVLGDGAVVSHIKVYDDVVEELELQSTDDVALVRQTILPTIKYLSQTLTIVCLVHTDENNTYYLPMTVNGIPALDALDPGVLENVTIEAVMGIPGGPPAFKVVIPPTPLSLEESVGWLLDFATCVANEINADKPSEPKGAKAWQGWKGGA